jgi:tetratricopeptide (TPR) repeat protein
VAIALNNERCGSTAERNKAFEGFEKGNPVNAQMLFERLRKKDIDRKSKDPWSAYTLGNIYFLQLKYSRAMMEFEAAERLDPENTDIQSSIGLVYIKESQFDQAVIRFRKALKNDTQALGDDHPKTGRD